MIVCLEQERTISRSRLHQIGHTPFVHLKPIDAQNT